MFLFLSIGFFFLVKLSSEWGLREHPVVRLLDDECHHSNPTVSTYEIALQQIMQEVTDKNLANVNAKFELFLHNKNELVNISMRSGHLFTTDQSHVLLQTETHSGKFYDLFMDEGEGYKPVIHREISRFASVSDTIADANADGYADLLLHRRISEQGYGVYDVYLQDNNTGKFLPRRESGTMIMQKHHRKPEYFHSGEAWNM